MTKDTAKPSLALIGSGYWGKNLARNFYELNVLNTICDSNIEALETQKKLYPDLNFSTDVDSLLNNPDINCVAIATPTTLHYPIAKKALLAGKDVFVEKPICLNCIQAEELLAIAESRNLILMVGHILHYHPCVEYLKDLLANRSLGNPLYIVSNRLSLGIMRTEENVLWNFAPHDVSLVLSLCNNQQPDEVRCTGESYLAKDVHDTALTILHFPGGLTAQIHTSWLYPFKEQRLTVIGTQGMAVFDDTKPWDEKLVVYHEPVKWQHNLPIPNKSVPEKIIVPKAEPLREECSHFLSCCLRRSTPYTDGREGLRVLRVLEAAQTSLNNNGEIQLLGQALSANAGSL